jgi:excisionase family DNA binding protein
MEKLLTCEQVAERYSVKVVTVYEWIKSRKLPAVKVAGRNITALLPRYIRRVVFFIRRRRLYCMPVTQRGFFIAPTFCFLKCVLCILPF